VCVFASAPLVGLERRDFREIDLEGGMPVRHAVFDPVVRRLLHARISWLEQLIDVSIPVEFQAYTDSPVEESARTENVQVRDTRFDDFCEYCTAAEVPGDAQLYFVAGFGIQELLYGTWEAEQFILGKIKERVNDFGVLITDRVAGFDNTTVLQRSWWCSRPGDLVVEPTV